VACFCPKRSETHPTVLGKIAEHIVFNVCRGNRAQVPDKSCQLNRSMQHHLIS
jgi:hypothetical protein